MPSFNQMTGLVMGPIVLADGNVHGPYRTTHWPLPATVDVYVAAGDTVTVYFSCDGGATYPTAMTYALSSSDRIVLTSGVTHLKFTRTAGAGVTSTVSAC